MGKVREGKGKKGWGGEKCGAGRGGGRGGAALFLRARLAPPPLFLTLDTLAPYLGAITTFAVAAPAFAGDAPRGGEASPPWCAPTRRRVVVVAPSVTPMAEQECNK